MPAKLSWRLEFGLDVTVFHRLCGGSRQRGLASFPHGAKTSESNTGEHP